MRPTVSIMAACEIVGVSRRTIYNWLKAGKLEYVRTAGGSVRIYSDTLWRPGYVPSVSDETSAAWPKNHACAVHTTDGRCICGKQMRTSATGTNGTNG